MLEDASPPRRLAGVIGAVWLCLLFALDPRTVAADERWPRWPTEIALTAAPLHAEDPQRPGDTERVHAVAALGRYAKGAIAHELALALRDPSVNVQREALRLCRALSVAACIPGAAALWGAGHDPQVRRDALKILALDPAPSRLAILLDALRDPSEHIRSGAAEVLGRTSLPAEGRTRVRAALVAKLSDVSANVRRQAVESLGLLAPGEGTLAIARLLEDPDPDVRVHAAQALGFHGDPGVVPALRRAVRANNEGRTAEAIVLALAQLPGRDVDETLLRLLDDPPEGVSAMQIATAIGRRPACDPLLPRGLVQRLREESLRGAAATALLWLGESARSALVEARRRGMEPELDVELVRLLGALDPPTEPRREPDRWPAASDREGWHKALQTADLDRRDRAALALAELNPPWLEDAVAGALSAPGNGPFPRAWLLVLARASGKLLAGRRRDLPWARAVGWARRADLAVGERCLAVAALGKAGGTRARTWVEGELLGLLGDPRAAIRGCATMALGALSEDPVDTILAMLHDPSAEVRASAALTLAALPTARVPPPARAFVALAGQRDPSGFVRSAARFAVARLAKGRPASTQAGWITAKVPPQAWIDPIAWVTVEVEGTEVWVPVCGDHERRWALVPGLGEGRTSKSELVQPRLGHRVGQ